MRRCADLHARPIPGREHAHAGSEHPQLHADASRRQQIGVRSAREFAHNDQYAWQCITYGYTNGKLAQIADSSGQKLALSYGSDGRIQYVAGPESSGNASRRIVYLYDAGGRLIEVDTQALQAAAPTAPSRSTKYQYNTSNQISGFIGPDGLTTLTNTPDLRGRSAQQQESWGTLSPTASPRMPQAATTRRKQRTWGPWAQQPDGTGHSRFTVFRIGPTSTTQFDSTARTTQATNALGNTTHTAMPARRSCRQR